MFHEFQQRELSSQRNFIWNFKCKVSTGCGSNEKLLVKKYCHCNRKSLLSQIQKKLPIYPKLQFSS